MVVRGRRRLLSTLYDSLASNAAIVPLSYKYEARQHD